MNEPWDFDFELLNQNNAGEHFKALKKMCNDAGLGPLKINEVIANFMYKRSLGQRLQNVVKAKVRLYILEGFNFAQKDLFLVERLTHTKYVDCFTVC